MVNNKRFDGGPCSSADGGYREEFHADAKLQKTLETREGTDLDRGTLC
jgi:hypothetical protein